MSYVIISAIIIMSGHRSIYRIEVGMSHIVIDESKCKSCFICINTCPKGLIKKSNRMSKLGDKYVEFNDPDNKCLGCAMCATRCPDMAIVEVHKS